jgi:hypothetical protein
LDRVVSHMLASASCVQNAKCCERVSKKTKTKTSHTYKQVGADDSVDNRDTSQMSLRVSDEASISRHAETGHQGSCTYWRDENVGEA